MHSGCEHLYFCNAYKFFGCVFCRVFVSTFVSRVDRAVVRCVWGVFVGVVVSVLGRSVDALVPGADEGRGRPR